MTTFCGFTDAELARIVRPVARGAETSHQVREAFARATWSGIAEPGDRVAGMLRSILGAQGALECVTSGDDATSIAHRLSAESAHGDEQLGEHEREITEALDRWRPRLKSTEATAHYERAARVGISFVTPEDDAWPHPLSDLAYHQPPGLWVRGDVGRLRDVWRGIAVVGARASTGYGEHVTMELVSGLCDRGFTIISGAAYGIDGMAHRSALASEGFTVAVLAGGVDRLYPSGHDTLLKRIIDDGVVIGELPCGWAPTRWRFLQRNRLIGALGQATVVVEAGLRSGSLNTAHHALNLDRPVGAVPGPITSASSAGCHRLLRETPAVCVTAADEVAQLVNFSESPAPGTSESQAAELHPSATRVLDALSKRTPKTVNVLAGESGLSESDVRAVIGLLAVNTLVISRADGWVRLTR